MMNPKYKSVADRLERLIEEGEEVAQHAESDDLKRFTGSSKRPLNSWLAKTDNILLSVFGEGSAHYSQFESIRDRSVIKQKEVYAITGILEGALDDLREGFLTGQEFLIAGEVFDSVIEQARHLKESHFKDPAAVLGRVVLEDALQRISREEGIDTDQKASQLNTDLWKSAERYSQPQWRKVQSWLDTGNAAAHGNFDKYTNGDVEDLLEGVEEFIATELRP
jgi:hypothetical protein